MSRATPRKAKGRLVGLAHGRQGRPQAALSPTGAMATAVLMAPEGVEDLTLPFTRPPELRNAGLRFSRQAPAPRAGTIEGDGPGADFGRLRPGAHLGATSGSASFGSPAPSTQPAVVFAPRDTSPSYLAPFAGAVAARWLPSWFRARPPSRLSDPFETCSGTSGG
jgi:hypothetical protein